MDRQRLFYLLSSWKEGSLAENEWKELELFFSDEANNDIFVEAADKLLTDNQLPPFDKKLLPVLDAVFAQEEKIRGGKKQGSVIKLIARSWLKYAAALLLCAGGALYFFKSTPKTGQQSHVKSEEKKEIQPGSFKAVLTLSDGTEQLLSSKTSGIITDADITINNTGDKLIYSKSSLVATNKMSTAKGGQYKLTLADGTDVWLNANSSITYPTTFIGNQRVVSITGEAYFEVATDKSKPFIVKTISDSVTVLGTAFNIRAYTEDGAVKTSLVQGSVKVNEKIIQPGQACINGRINVTNIEQDIAWKNGYFDFDHTTLPEVMHQLERWYDIEVKYKNKIPQEVFRGQMDRNVQLSDVIGFLQAFGVKAKLEGRTLIIE